MIPIEICLKRLRARKKFCIISAYFFEGENHMNTYAQSVLDQLKKRFPTQKEFLQAATEIIDSLSLVFDRDRKSVV